MVQAQMRHPRRALSSVTLLAAACLVALLCAGCGGGSSAALSPSPMPSVLPTLMPTAAPAPPPPTATPITNCADAVEAPATKITTLPSFPLPANTVTYRLPSAAGAGFYLECTLGATQASIVAFLNARLPEAGWHPWNPQTDDAGGCGTQYNSYWLWSDSQDAVGWDFNHVTLPEWHLTFCILAFASPTS